jgi:hypothetical protein
LRGILDDMFDDDTARDLALFAGLDWDDDADALAPLIDATIVWADEEQLDAIAAPIVEALWADELRDDIERALDSYAERPSALSDALADARADLELGPAGSRLALAYVKQGAVDLGDPARSGGRCLCCIEDGLTFAPAESHEAIAIGTALAIVREFDPEFGAGSLTDEARRRACDRLRQLGALAERSLPRLSAALLDLARDSPDDDRLWRAACASQCD